MKLILLLTIVTFSCKTEDVKKELISEFIEKVILDKSYNIDNINEYLDLEKDSLIPDSELLKFLNFNIDFLRGEIKDMKQLDIMSYKDFIDNEKFSSYNINYPKSEDVFFVVKKNKLITSIIVSDDTKILSFFTGLIKHKDNINPYMINKR